MPKLDERISSLESKLQALKQKQQMKDRADRQLERQRARKAENQRKFALGGLFKVAGLFHHDAGVLLGALLSVRPWLDDPTHVDELKRAGDALLASRERERMTTTGAHYDAASAVDEYLR